MLPSVVGCFALVACYRCKAANGACCGQTARTLAKAKSRRWQDGGKGTREAVARFFRTTAWFSRDAEARAWLMGLSSSAR